MFIFTKEMAGKLVECRKRANLTQKELGLRMGMKKTSAQSTINRLESGVIKNPGVGFILDYLIVCQADWRVFIEIIHRIWSKNHLKELVPQTELPSDTKISKKIDRDASLYATKISGLPKPIDISTLRDRVERKVKLFLSNHRLDVNFIPVYLSYADKIIDWQRDPKLSLNAVEKQFIKSNITPNLFHPVRRIVIDTVRNIEKQHKRKKPITSEKQKKMVQGYLRFRVDMEQIEADVNQVLNDLQIKEVFYLSYKDFARECYKIIRKYYNKDPLLLKQNLDNIVVGWKSAGLDEEILQKVRKAVIEKYKKIRQIITEKQ